VSAVFDKFWETFVEETGFPDDEPKVKQTFKELYGAGIAEGRRREQTTHKSHLRSIYHLLDAALPGSRAAQARKLVEEFLSG
jgi:hypothetical protein